jgi:hypothetical protein
MLVTIALTLEKKEKNPALIAMMKAMKVETALNLEILMPEVEEVAVVTEAVEDQEAILDHLSAMTIGNLLVIVI